MLVKVMLEKTETVLAFSETLTTNDSSLGQNTQNGEIGQHSKDFFN